ncbi:MAG: response regulator [Ruthenibacterium sp.]
MTPVCGKKIRVLIAENDLDSGIIEKAQIESQPDLVCCGIANDGKETLAMIEKLKPDVVLLDLVMPVLDGLGVLEYMHKHKTADSPRFLVITSDRTEHIVHEMMHCGADYFLEKPCDAVMLARRVRFVHHLNDANGGRNLWMLEQFISQHVLAIGIPAKVLGYNYVQEALCALLEQENRQLMFKQIYLEIAARHKTDASCVESAIACAIKAAMASYTPTLQSVLALSPALAEKRTISNGQFLTIVAQSIRLQESKRSEIHV